MHRTHDVEARRLIADNTREALANKRMRGERVGQIPFGYALAPDKRTLKPDPHEMGVIDWVVARYEEGESLREIAERLNSHGFGNRAGGLFTHEQVRRMLLRALNVERLCDVYELA